jgi:hypothetical protein
VRDTWRAKGNASGEESSGFRVVIPITDFVPPPAPTAAIATKPLPTIAGATPSLSGAVLSAVPWDKIVDALAPSKASAGSADE